MRTRRQHTLASTFLRFQEHYESPKFRGNVFSLEEFMDWYAIEFGNFTYYQDWSGFNIPSSVLKPFHEGGFNPLSKKEEVLLNLLSDVPEPFYVVGIFGKKLDLPTLKHELVHGLYHGVPEYRHEVLSALKASDTRTLRNALKKAGYHSSVHEDESNAYILMGGSDLNSRGFRWNQRFRRLQTELRNIFHRHFGFSLKGAGSSTILSHFHQIDFDAAIKK